MTSVGVGTKDDMVVDLAKGVVERVRGRVAGPSVRRRLLLEARVELVPRIIIPPATVRIYNIVGFGEMLAHSGLSPANRTSPTRVTEPAVAAKS